MDYQEAIHCMKVMAEEEVCEECNYYYRCDHYKQVDMARIAISAMQELQELHNQGFSLERLKDIDFRKEVVEHINYDAYMSLMDELEEYKNLGTLEEVREAVEKHNECKNCAYKTHSNLISKLNNCNDCGLKNTCVKRPEYGDYCRINCYDWRKQE